MRLAIALEAAQFYTPHTSPTDILAPIARTQARNHVALVDV